MASARQPLSRLQIGIETAAGTLATTTRSWRYREATYENMITLEEFNEQVSGTFARTATKPFVTRFGTQLQYNSEFSFEQIMLPLASGVKGAATTTTPTSATKARLHTWAPGLAAAPALETYSLEYGFHDGTNQRAFRAPYAFTTEFTVGGSAEGISMLGATMMARRTVEAAAPTTITRPDLSYGANISWGFTDDSSWANLGDTALLGTVNSFEATWRDFVSPKYSLDGRADKDFSSINLIGRRVLDITAQVVIDPASSSFWRTHLAAKEAGTKRFLRGTLTGDVIETVATVDLHNFFYFEGAFVHASDSLTSYGTDEDGEAVVDVHLMSIADGTNGDVQFAVQNGLASFP